MSDPVQDSRLLEALLFASAEPLTLAAIRERMPQDADVGGLLLALQKDYEKRGVTLTEFDGCWAFRTASDLGDSLRMRKEVQRKLSRAAMETLAIIAYHQPVTRAEVESIRGVATNKGTLDVLMECGWIKPGRRREAPGRPLTWVTTTTFLDQFGLEAVTDLPGLDDLKASGLLDRRPALESIAGGTASLFADDDLEDDAPPSSAAALEEEFSDDTLEPMEEQT
jgi:segregation and condensation protein B